MYDEKSGLFVKNFIENLKLTTGKWYGKNFELLKWQSDIVYDFYGTLKDNGYRQYEYLYLEIPKKNGKCLHTETDIPTPLGWKKMKDLKPSDYVFGDDGKPCKILYATDSMYDHKCYKVVFEDGNYIIADDGHLWETTTYIPWMKTKLHNTIDIKNTLNYQKGFNHKIKVASHLEYGEKELLIHPYVLGVWLGDGRTDQAAYTQSIHDCEIESKINSFGVPTRHYKEINPNVFQIGLGDGDKRQKSRNNSIQARLRKINVLNNKHIPDIYLQSSYEQRLDLLRGLMDSDGFISKVGQCVYSTCLKELSDNVFELIASLGMKPRFSVKEINGYKDSYMIQFWAFNDIKVAYLSRKNIRQKERPKKDTRAFFRKIIAVEDIDSVPVRCIRVDNKSNLFLAGKSMIPTHNTELAAALGVYHLFADGEKNGEVYSCAAEKGQASIAFDVAVSMIDQCPALKKRCKLKVSQKTLIDKVSGTKYVALSAEAFSKHGFKPSAVIFDELHAQPNRDLWDVMTFGAGDIRDQPVWIVITTAGNDPDLTSIGWEIHEKSRKIIAGETEIDHWYCKIYGADDSMDIYDEKVWYDVNPSLGTTIDIDKVRKAAKGAKTNEAEEKLFRWLRLNQWVKVKETGWITHYLWDSVEKKIDVLKLHGKKCYAGLDLSSTVDLTAFSLVFPPQEGIDEWIILTEGWVPEKNIQKRIRVDKVPYDKWINKKFINATPGSAVDYDFIQATIEKYSKLFDIIYLGADQWNSRMLTQRLKKSVGMRVIEVPQTMTGMSQGMKYLERLIRDRKIAHTGNPVERWCIGNVVVQVDGNENIKPMKNKSKERIDIAVAIINAMAIAVKYEKGSIYENRGVITL